MKTELNVLFKSQQKDDKKEVLKFEIKGSENTATENEWYTLAGSIVIFNIAGCPAGDVTAEFMSMQRDSKKTVVKFAIKGDSEEKARELYRFAGRNVQLSVVPSQMSIEEYYDEEGEHEGLKYNVDGDGTVNVDSDQLSIEDVQETDGEADDDELPI